MLWIDKYKPKNISNFIGNRKQLESIKKWIQEITKRKMYKPLLLCGNTGTGKTTLAKLLFKSMNCYILPIDYDSFIDKSSTIHQTLDKYTNSKTIEHIFLKKNITKGILFDDIDCFGDKSVIRAFISYIKNNSTQLSLPLIITCKTSTKLRDIKKLCVEIKLSPPTKVLLFNYAKKIVKQEKINIEDSALQYYVKQSHYDYRKLLNTLYYIHLNNKTNTITFEKSMDTMEMFFKKNSNINIYEIIRSVLNQYTSISKMLHLCETDNNILGLMFHENYINTVVTNRKDHRCNKLTIINKISKLLASADILKETIIEYRFTLDHYKIFFEIIYPSYLLNHKLKKYAYNKVNTIDFTKILSNSSQTYHNYKTIKLHHLIIDDSNKYLVFNIILELLFHHNKKKAFDLIKLYDISFTIIEKYIILYFGKFKKFFTKAKKRKIIKIFNHYLLQKHEEPL